MSIETPSPNLLPQSPPSTVDRLKLPGNPVDRVRQELFLQQEFQKYNVASTMPPGPEREKLEKNYMKNIYGGWGNVLEQETTGPRGRLLALRDRLSSSGLPENIQTELKREMDQLIHEDTTRPMDPFATQHGLRNMRKTIANLGFINSPYIVELQQTLGEYGATFYETRPLAYNLPERRPYAANDKRGMEILRLGGFMASAVVATGALIAALFQARKTGEAPDLTKTAMFLTPALALAAGPGMLSPASQKMREQVGSLADRKFNTIAGQYGLQGDAGADVADKIFKADADTKKLLALKNPTPQDLEKIAAKIPGLRNIMHDPEAYKYFVAVIQQAKSDDSRKFAMEFLRQRVGPQDLAALGQMQPRPVV